MQGMYRTNSHSPLECLPFFEKNLRSLAANIENQRKLMGQGAPNQLPSKWVIMFHSISQIPDITVLYIMRVHVFFFELIKVILISTFYVLEWCCVEPNSKPLARRRCTFKLILRAAMPAVDGRTYVPCILLAWNLHEISQS